MKRLFLVVLSVFLLGTGGCTHSSTPASDKNAEQVVLAQKTALEQLNALERQIYDALLVNLKTWKSATKVRFFDFDTQLEYLQDGSARIVMTVKGYDEKESSKTSNYYLYMNHAGKTTPYGSFVVTNMEITSADHIKVSPWKINAAIDEYWEEIGLK